MLARMMSGCGMRGGGQTRDSTVGSLHVRGQGRTCGSDAGGPCHSPFMNSGDPILGHDQGVEKPAFS